MPQSETSVFPDEFSDLEPFRTWALASHTERQVRRIESSMEEIDRVYQGVLPRVGAILHYLDARGDVDSLDGADERLLWLMLSLSEVGFAAERLRSPTVDSGVDGRRFVVSGS